MELDKGYYKAEVAGLVVTMSEEDMHNFWIGNQIHVNYNGREYVRRVRDFPEDIGIVISGYPFYYSDFKFVSSDEDLD